MAENVASWALAFTLVVGQVGGRAVLLTLSRCVLSDSDWIDLCIDQQAPDRVRKSFKVLWIEP